MYTNALASDQDGLDPSEVYSFLHMHCTPLDTDSAYHFAPVKVGFRLLSDSSNLEHGLFPGSRRIVKFARMQRQLRTEEGTGMRIDACCV